MSIISPSPPPRKYPNSEFDLDSILAQRAKRMLAAGTAASRAGLSTSHAVVSTSSSKPSGAKDSGATKHFERHRHRLEWDPHAVPLLLYAETEARSTLQHAERDHRLSVAASIHVTLAFSLYADRLNRLENESERVGRHALCAEERAGRARLWQGHEELVVAHQLKELDYTREQALVYMHRPSVDALKVTAADSTGQVSKMDDEEWVLGITYLITYDLVMLERKERIAKLKYESYERREMLECLKTSHAQAHASFSNRRHAERCEYYRAQVLLKTSQVMLYEHLIGPVREEWMLMSLSLFTAAWLNEHRVFLQTTCDRQWQTLFNFDEQQQLIRKEQWHRHQEQALAFDTCVIELTATHYYQRLQAIADEERRVYDQAFLPWIRSAPQLCKLTKQRQVAAIKIQVFFRSIRQRLRGYRITHKRIGADVARMRQIKARYDAVKAGELRRLMTSLLAMEAVEMSVDSAVMSLPR